MRSAKAVGYSEIRDAIARDWYPFLANLGLENDWILLPNLGDDTVPYAIRWGVDALILSGGDNMGNDFQRDKSEFALLNYCIEKQFPVLGVCRGAQLILHYFGGQVVPTDPMNHRATRHEVKITASLPWWHGPYSGNVNSYHTNKLAYPLPDELSSFATAGEECEGVMHKSFNIVGIMWHPEREVSLSDFDRKLCRWLFA